MDMDVFKLRALEIFDGYTVFNRKSGLKEWDRSDVVRGFVGDVGALAKYTMAADGVRVIEGHEEKLEHELADCLWSLLVIADKYGVDLESCFFRTMDELEKRVEEDMS